MAKSAVAKFEPVISVEKPSAKTSATSRRKHEDATPWFSALSTYLGYAVLILFGHIRDALGKTTGYSRYFIKSARTKVRIDQRERTPLQLKPASDYDDRFKLPPLSFLASRRVTLLSCKTGRTSIPGACTTESKIAGAGQSAVLLMLTNCPWSCERPTTGDTPSSELLASEVFCYLPGEDGCAYARIYIIHKLHTMEVVRMQKFCRGWLRWACK
jgi:hypothetical protein